MSAPQAAAADDAPPLTRAFWEQAAGLWLRGDADARGVRRCRNRAAAARPGHYRRGDGRQLAPGALLPVSVVTDAPPRRACLISSASTCLLAGRRIIAGRLGGRRARATGGSPAPRRLPHCATGRTGATGQKSAVEQPTWPTRSPGDRPTDEGMAQFLVPRDRPGLTVRPLPRYDLGRIFADVALSEVRLPGDALLGEPGGIDTSLEHQVLPRCACRRRRPRPAGADLRRDDQRSAYPVRLRPAAGLLPGAQAPDRRSQTLLDAALCDLHGAGAGAGRPCEARSARLASAVRNPHW